MSINNTSRGVQNPKAERHIFMPRWINLRLAGFISRLAATGALPFMQDRWPSVCGVNQ